MFFSTDNDDDMKIAGSDIHSSPREDAGDIAAKQFLAQKDAGNIDVARNLGTAYAKAILDIGNHNDFLSKQSTMLEAHHQILLCAYIVNKVIAGKSPNSILAQTSLGRFYDEISSSAPHMYGHISDMAAFSLYILNDRSDDLDEEVGRIYARLCGFENDSQKVDDGNRIYSRFYDFCAGLMENAGYIIV